MAHRKNKKKSYVTQVSIIIFLVFSLVSSLWFSDYDFSSLWEPKQSYSIENIPSILEKIILPLIIMCLFLKKANTPQLLLKVIVI